MGKKMGINTKAVEARERKEAQKKAKSEAIERRKADEYWKDDDKHVNRKMGRQREREQKAQEERQRKAANKAAYELDMEQAEKSAKSRASKQQQQQQQQEVVAKVTRHEIQRNLEEEEEGRQLSRQLRKVNLVPTPLAPNLNRLEEGESATGIDQALDLLKSHSTSSSSSFSSKQTKAK